MKKVSERKTRLSFATDAEVTTWGSQKGVGRKRVSRNIIIDVDNGWNGSVRLKGIHQKFEFSWQGLYEWAVQNHVNRLRREKK